MKRLLALLLSLLLVLSFSASAENTPRFSGMNDPALLQYIEDDLYEGLVSTLDSEEYFVENVQAVYISQEYLDEVAYNSQANVFFGFTLAELEAQFEGERYVFTLGDDGTTQVQPFEDYDDTYDRILHNIAVGTGVILVCVTVSVATGGVAPAVSMIFAVSAKTASVAALSGGALGGVAAGITTGIQTKDLDSALKAAALSGSEGFKWGAITGAISGGASEAIALKGATLKGLTMNEAAMIQRDSKWSLDIIKNISSVEEYNLYKSSGLNQICLDGKYVLAQNVDWNLVDKNGLTNYQRVVEKGLSPIDTSGTPFEVHHIRQSNSYALLTAEQHRYGENYRLLHSGIEEGVDHGYAWQKTVTALWESFVETVEVVY